VATGRVRVITSLAIGVAIVVALVLANDGRAIGTILVQQAPSVAAITAFHLIPLGLAALSWRRLLRVGAIEVPFVDLFWLRLVADSVNQLLPVAQLGGEIVRGSLLVRRGVALPISVATVVVDNLLGLLSLLVFIVGGLLTAVRLRAGSPLSVALVLGILGASALVGAVVFVMRMGTSSRILGLLRKLGLDRVEEAWRAEVVALDEAVVAITRDRRACLAAGMWRLLAWVAGALEMWIALRWLHPATTPRESIALEAIAQVWRNAGFALPAALGAQEAGYLSAGAIVGIPANAALALAFLKRARDLLLGVPTILAWRWREPESVRSITDPP
jgi:putative membrane protein